MKISNSKKELARIISENGGWRNGAESAAQCKSDNAVSFYRDIPDRDGDCWWGEYLDGCDIGQDRLIANWHQSCLSRAEYFHLYPAPDTDGWIEWKGGECPVGEGDRIDVKFSDGDEFFDVGSNWGWDVDAGGCNIIAYRLHKHEKSLGELCGEAKEENKHEHIDAKPTIEQLAADYHNAKDYAERKQQEADAAKADADEKLRVLEIAGEAHGLLVSPITAKQDPELVITDWRNLRVGDVIWIGYREGNKDFKGECTILELDIDDDECPFGVIDCNGNDTLLPSIRTREWRFICRP